MLAGRNGRPALIGKAFGKVRAATQRRADNTLPATGNSGGGYHLLPTRGGELIIQTATQTAALLGLAMT